MKGKGMNGYRDLKVYKRSYQAALAVYRMSKSFPKEERYAVTSQIERAAMSVPLNIAEGYAKRSSQQEFKRFLLMAVGSANEVSVLLDFAKDLGYIAEKQYLKASQEYDEIGRMLSEFIKAIGSRI